MSSLMISVAGLGAAIMAPTLARMVARVLRRILQKLKESLLSVETPEWARQRYSDFVTSAVSFAEHSIASDEFWAQAFFILRGNPGKISERLLDLMASINWKDGLKQALPSEVREFVNEVRHNVALDQTRASIASLPVEHQPNNTKISEDIKALAPSVGKTVVAVEQQVSNDEIQRRIAETKRKLMELMGK